MIIELFYPNILKEIISDLQDKDDLNEEPLKRKKGLIIFMLCIMLTVIPVMIIYNPYDANYIEKILPYILIPLVPFVMYLEEREKCKNFAKLYNYGRCTEAICQRRVFLTLNGYELRVKFYLDNGKEVMADIKIPEDGTSYFLPFDKRFRNKKKITVYYDPENSKKAVVFSKKTANLFYLRKTKPPFPPI